MRTQLMPVLESQRGREGLAYGGVVVIWIISLVISFSANNEQARSHYHLTEGSLHILQMIFSLPALFIWLAILFAVLSFYRYARQIQRSQESPAFRYIAYGLAAALFTSIVTTYLSGLQVVMSEHITHRGTVEDSFIIIRNYVALVGALATYWWLYKSSQALLATIGEELDIRRQNSKAWLPFVFLAIVYFSLILSNPSRQFSSDSNVNPTFALPDFLTIVTVALPYLAAWFMGCVSLVGIYRYRQQTKGIVYKRLFTKLWRGLVTVVSLTIILQLLSQFANFFAETGLNAIIAIISLIYFILIAAYLLVARGALELNKIEVIGSVRSVDRKL